MPYKSKPKEEEDGVSQISSWLEGLSLKANRYGRIPEEEERRPSKKKKHKKRDRFNVSPDQKHSEPKKKRHRHKKSNENSSKQDPISARLHEAEELIYKRMREAQKAS